MSTKKPSAKALQEELVKEFRYCCSRRKRKLQLQLKLTLLQHACWPPLVSAATLQWQKPPPPPWSLQNTMRLVNQNELATQAEEVHRTELAAFLVAGRSSLTK